MTSPGPSPVASSPVGLHRVLEPAGVLPQAAQRLDASPADRRRRGPDRGRAAQPRRGELPPAAPTKHGGDGDAVRAAVLEIIDERGKMQNPVTGSGGMLIGTVDEVGPDSPLGLKPGDRVATLVSLTLTPLRITDGLAGWDGRSEQVPAQGHAILFGRSIAAVLPDDLEPETGAGRARRLRRAGPDRPGSPRATRRVADRRGARRRRQVRVAVAGRGPAGRCPDRRGRPEPGRAGPPGTRPASPTTSRWPTPATRSRSPTPSPARWAARPTSPSSASTCPAASTARSWPPPRAAPSSSSAWPPRSRPRRWARRGSPPTSRC